MMIIYKTLFVFVGMLAVVQYSSAQNKVVIKPWIQKQNLSAKPADSAIFIVPNAVCDSITLIINDRPFKHKIVNGTDSVRAETALHYKLKKDNTLKTICGNVTTEPIHFSNTVRYVYVSMTDMNCLIYLCNTMMNWENN